MDKNINLILEDLKFLFERTEIPATDIDNVIQQLKSQEAKKYVEDLRAGSKPETAMREAFFAGTNSLFQVIAPGSSPEVNVKEGFIDYKIGKGRRAILLELKPSFEAHRSVSIGGKGDLKKLREVPLNWEAHKKQILKYIHRDGEYIIFTNLREWAFFNEMVSSDNFAPFLTIKFDEFFKDLETSGEIRNYLLRRDSESTREDLDKKFFESLNSWVEKFDEIKFVDSNEKTRRIIGTLNKFIFIQTLDDFEIIDFNWIYETWDHIEHRWKGKGIQEILKQFFGEVNVWFYEHYDTELFTTQIIDYLDADEKNLNKFYHALKLVLGITYLEEPLGYPKGIIQYNFKHINEDIFGKAYEQYLARVRHDEAIYYTPPYVTEYIAENTVGKIFDDLFEKIVSSLKNESFDDLTKYINDFISIKILDPACGSGSFLVKSFKKILQRYEQLDQFLLEKYKEYSPESGNYEKSSEQYLKIDEIRNKLKVKKKRELITSILLRHIHGNDLDKGALAVAKVNLWLESIKSAPQDFRYTALGDSNRILPYLEMNLVCGDAVVGLDENIVIDYLKNNQKDELKKLFSLRQSYLDDPSNPQQINQIEQIQEMLISDLETKFRSKLQELGVSEDIIDHTIPLHWPVRLFHMYFDENGVLPDEKRGAHCVIGNPPYLDSETMTKKIPLERKFCTAVFDSASGNWDIFCVFIEKGIRLTRQDGKFGYIVPNKLLSVPYANETCNFLRKYNVDSLRDYSTVNVFDADVYPIVLTVSKTDTNPDNELNIEIMVEVENALPKVSTQKSIKLSELYALDNNLWASIFESKQDLDLSGQIYSQSIKFSEINEISISGAASVAEAYEIKKILREIRFGDKAIKKFINTGTIDPYSSLWGKFPTQYIKDQYPKPVVDNDKLKQLFSSRYDEANSPKIIIGGMTKGIEAFLDSDGEYLAGKSTTIITSEKYNLKPLVAFFNSSLATFVVRAFKGMALAGGYLKIGPPMMKDIPISTELLIERDKENELTKLVDELQVFESSKNEFDDIWEKWCKKLCVQTKTLFSVLDDDFSEITKGADDKAWFKDAEFYPAKNNEKMSKEYDDYELEIDKDSLKLIILSSEENKEIFYITFKDLETLTHIFLSLKKTIESSKQIPTLKDLFEKTDIPIITPNYIKVTKNIIEKTIDEFKNLKRNEVPENIIDIIDKIKDDQIVVDFLMLTLYGLNAEQATTVLNTMETTETHKNRVLEKMREKENESDNS